MRNTKVVKDEDLQKVGDAAEALKTPNAKLVSASYDFAIHTHGSIGPSCAVAEYVDGKLTVWSASQQTHLLRKQIAMMLGDEARRRALHLHRRRGLLRPQRARGRRGRCRADREGDRAAGARAVDARRTSTAGIPKGPPTLLDYQAAIDAQGNVVALAVRSLHSGSAEGHRGGAAAGGARGPADRCRRIRATFRRRSAIPYTFPNIRATAHWLAETPFRPSWIRTPGRMQNTFGNESFLDEIAVAAGVDPLEFRLKNLKDPRGAELLQALGELAELEAAQARARR